MLVGSELRGARAQATEPASRGRALLWLLVAAGLAKLTILFLVGPIFAPDSGHYVRYAEAIMDGRAFVPLPWGAEAMPYLIFRPPGYPLFLAATMLISPADYAVIAVIGQGIVCLVAISIIFTVAERLLRSWRAALVATALYAGSISLLWDDAILSDSLFASLWNIVIFALLGHLLGCWRLMAPRVLALGLMWGYAIWLRDTGVYFTALPLVLLTVMAIREWRASRRGAAAAILFPLVVSAMVGGIVGLNKYRTGEAVFSITGVANWLQPVLEMARRGYARPFDGDDFVSTTIRETLPDYAFDRQLALVAELHRRCQCTPTRLQAIEFAKYRSAVTQSPLAYGRVVLKNFNYFALGELVADPVATFNQFLELGVDRPEWRFPGLSLRNLRPLGQQFRLAALVKMVVSVLGELVAGVAFTIYLVGTPLLLWCAIRKRDIAMEAAAVAGFLWVSFLGVCLAFSLVHIEARYVLPVLPAAAIGTVFAARRLRHLKAVYSP